MDNDLSRQFKAWVSNNEPGKPDFIEHLKKHDPWVFAHHPAHACFREHVWKINGLYICKGCLVTSIGFMAGLGFQVLTDWLSMYSEEVLAFIFVSLLFPTLITSSFRSPREVKHLSRFLLGFLMASSLLLVFITERWEVRLVVISTYITLQYFFEKKRKIKNRELLINSGTGH